MVIKISNESQNVENKLPSGNEMHTKSKFHLLLVKINNTTTHYSYHLKNKDFRKYRLALLRKFYPFLEI